VYGTTDGTLSDEQTPALHSNKKKKHCCGAVRWPGRGMVEEVGGCRTQGVGVDTCWVCRLKLLLAKLCRPTARTYESMHRNQHRNSEPGEGERAGAREQERNEQSVKEAERGHVERAPSLKCDGCLVLAARVPDVALRTAVVCSDRHSVLTR